MNAIELAVKYHNGQYRKGELSVAKLPYIVHPIEVMTRLWMWGVGERYILDAAVCHDLLEDTKCTWEELLPVIGEQATNIVKELTYLPSVGYDKDSYLEEFKNKSLEAVLIKTADRLCNVDDYYMSGEIEYAEVYFAKAKPVLLELDKRKEQITERFSLLACTKIRAEVAGTAMNYFSV